MEGQKAARKTTTAKPAYKHPISGPKSLPDLSRFSIYLYSFQACEFLQTALDVGVLRMSERTCKASRRFLVAFALSPIASRCLLFFSSLDSLLDSFVASFFDSFLAAFSDSFPELCLKSLWDSFLTFFFACFSGIPFEFLAGLLSGFLAGFPYEYVFAFLCWGLRFGFSFGFIFGFPLQSFSDSLWDLLLVAFSVIFFRIPFLIPFTCCSGSLLHKFRYASCPHQPQRNR